jgi:hypothetical protein
VLALQSIVDFILIFIVTQAALIVSIVCRELVRGKVSGCKTKWMLRLLPNHFTKEYRKVEGIQLNLMEMECSISEGRNCLSVGN